MQVQKSKKINTLSIGEYNYEGGRGGEIGAFWHICGKYKIFGDTNNNLEMYNRQQISQDQLYKENALKNPCSDNEKMYDFSPVREDENERDAPEIITATITKLNQEYKENYGLELDFRYDAVNDYYYACTRSVLDVQPPFAVDCPEGYARDFDGKCKPNVPKTKCCGYEIPIPNNPKDMLPITTLFKNKNEIGKLNEDVLIDIFTEKKVGNVVLDTRKKVLTGWIWGF